MKPEYDTFPKERKDLLQNALKRARDAVNVSY